MSQKHKYKGHHRVRFSEENKMVRLYNLVFDNESFRYDPK